MLHHFPWGLIATFINLIFGVYIIAFGDRATSQDPKSRLVEKTGSMMQFRAPTTLRRSSRVFAGVFVFIAICILFMVRAVLNPMFVYFVLPLPLLLAALLIYLSGPDDLRLDAAQRTYEWTIGWPWQPRVQTGTFDEVQGIQLTTQKMVVLVMRRRVGFRSRIVLGSSLSREEAVTFAQQVSQATSIPVIP